MLDFFRTYFEVRQRTPGLTEVQYHREVNRMLHRECKHPFPLLERGIGGPNYLKTRVEEVAPDCRDARLTTSFFDAHKDELWCPVCECFPWNPQKNEEIRRTGVDFSGIDAILEETNRVEDTYAVRDVSTGECA